MEIKEKSCLVTVEYEEDGRFITKRYIIPFKNVPDLFNNIYKELDDLGLSFINIEFV